MQFRGEPNSRDVLDEVLGGRVRPAEVGSLSSEELLRAREALEQFFLEWSPPPLSDGELRVSVGEQHLRRGSSVLGDLVLYAHTVVIRDPLERWIEARPGGGETATARELAAELRLWESMEELIDFGVVLPAPFLGRTRWKQVIPEPEEHWELVKEAGSKASFAEAVLGGLPAKEEHWPLLLLEEDPNFPHRDLSLVAGLPDPERDGELFAALNAVLFEASNKVERLLHARNSGAIFVPLSLNDQAFVEAGLPGLIRPVESKAKIDAEVISTLNEIQVPMLNDLSTRNLVAARKSADGFEEWRAYLRQVLESTATATGDDLEKMTYLVNDRLELAAAEVRREVSSSNAFTKAARDSVSVVSVNAILWGGAAAVFGTQPWNYLVGGGFGALASVLAAPLMRRTPAGYRGVLLQLIE